MVTNALTVHRRVQFLLCISIGYCASVQVSMRFPSIVLLETWYNLKKSYLHKFSVENANPVVNYFVDNKDLFFVFLGGGYSYLHYLRVQVI